MSEQLGMTVKKKDFNKWYLELVQKSDLTDYASIDGFVVFKPYAYAIWEMFQKVVDTKLKEMGIKNAYFPVLIPERLLKKEAEHFEGFTPEVAWVTHAGKTELGERLAVRPTSETIMYDSYSKWIRSWRDLPLRLNQWNAVVRWEFKHAKPFLRTREFLWNEGHTVFATQEEAEKECKEILEMYDWFCREYLALPGTMGRKTEKEKFAGAVYTTTIEFMMPDGKVIQGPDSHFDGQNFAKGFDIKFLDKNEKENFVYQNTWAISTRMIGVLIANHGDDRGLVLPPRIAPIQIVIIPIYKDKDKEKVLKEAGKIRDKLKKIYAQGGLAAPISKIYAPISKSVGAPILEGLRVELDDRDQYTPGFKFNDWELKGVPIRIEIGPKDIVKKQAVLVRRDTSEKKAVKIASLEKEVGKLLADIQKNLYRKAEEFVNEHTKTAKDYKELKKFVGENRVKACWCGSRECEDAVKDETTAKISCLPLKEEKVFSACVKCGKKAKKVVIFARSY
ncbi:MAG: proline--tRNA ligase [Candidatus Aenigmarchaeota archaeon]|nr:proline--tRNA ligase [Candidatus Aenigmarchaeota archaeon]